MPENVDLETRGDARHNPQAPTYLFLVRLWAESDDNGDDVWCGKVQHVTRAGASQFRDWCDLIDVFTALLASSPGSNPQKAADK